MGFEERDEAVCEGANTTNADGNTHGITFGKRWFGE